MPELRASERAMAAGGKKTLPPHLAPLLRQEGAESRDPWISKEHILTAPGDPTPPSPSPSLTRARRTAGCWFKSPCHAAGESCRQAKKSQPPEREVISPPYLESDKPHLDAIIESNKYEMIPCLHGDIKQRKCVGR